MKLRLLQIILFTIIIVWLAIQLYPVIIMFLNSLKDSPDYVSNPWGFPRTIKFENWSEIWSGGRVGTSNRVGIYFLNSSIISICTITLISFIAVITSYALTFSKLPGKKVIVGIIIASIAIPAQALLIPIYHFMGDLGLRNNYLGIISVYTGFWLPFTILILRANLKSIPFEIIEAAKIDGCSEPRLIWSVIIPLARGALVSLAIVNIIGIWSELLYAYILMNQPATRTITVGILALSGEYVTDWPQIFAGLSISCLPLISLYILFQRQITKAMTLGAIK